MYNSHSYFLQSSYSRYLWNSGASTDWEAINDCLSIIFNIHVINNGCPLVNPGEDFIAFEGIIEAIAEAKPDCYVDTIEVLD